MLPEPLRATPSEARAPAYPSFLASGRVGPYVLHDVLGEGGMGIVFRATHPQRDAEYALKTVNRLTRRRILALREEIVALRSVEHPGVVRILDQGSHEGIPWYVMELLTGKTLAHYNDQLWDAGLEVTRSGVSRSAWTDAPDSGSPAPLQREVAPQAAVAGGSLEEALRLYRELCEPLGHIHARGMVHRDLKPQNVFIRSDGQPVLMDFGLIGYASGAVGREVLEAGNQGFGTVHYVSPERIDGQQVDARADLYSLGCMLYETLVGRPPFVGDAAHVLAQHVSAAPVGPSQILNGVPAAIERLILQLLAKTPRARVGHARDVATALTRILGDERTPEINTQAVPLFRPQLSGREEVLAQLSSSLDRALERRGGLVLIGGESGIGKTFLTSELAHSAVRRGFRVVTGGANQFAPNAEVQAGDSVGPFQALRSLLQTVADTCRENGPQERDRVLGRRALYLAPFEPSLEAFVDFEAQAQPDTLPGAANLERIKTALTETLHAYASSGPLLIIVDDVQWADKLSTDFLASLGRAFFDGLPLVVVCAYRSEYSQSAVEAMRASQACTSLYLEKLGDVAVRRMVTDMLSSEPPAELVSFLVRESQGNPFFVAEYLRFLVAGKHLERAGGRWLASNSAVGAGEYGAVELPGKLEQLLTWRLRALSAPAQRVVEAGAVLGRAFQLETLALLLGDSEERLIELLQEARERLVLESLSLNSYQFRHDKLREVTYAALALAVRRDLHARAARALEAAPAGEPGTARSRELAFHYELGGELRQALTHFVRAGEEALAKAASHEAIDHFRAALRLEAKLGGIPPTERARCLRMLGGALHDIGDFPEGNAHLEQALELLGERCPRNRRRPIGLLILTEVLKQARARLWRQRPRIAPASESALQRAKIHGRIQEAAYYQDDALPMLYSCLRMLNLAEQVAPSPSLTVAYTNARAVAGIIPSARLATRYAALAHQNMAAAPSAVARAHFCLVAVGYASGIADWPAAFAAAEEGLAACASIDFARRSRELCAASSNARYLASEFGAARAAAESARAQAAGKDAHSHCWSLLLEAQVLLVQGQLVDSLDRLQTAKALLRTLGRPERIWLHGLEAFVCAKLEDEASALRASDAALADIVGAPLMNYFVVDSVARCAEARLWLARIGTGESALRQASALQMMRALRAMKRPFPIAEPRLLLLEGLQRRLHGNVRAAHAAFRASEQAAARLKMPYERARALLARSTAGTAAHGAALRLLQSLGAAAPPAQPL